MWAATAADRDLEECHREVPQRSRSVGTMVRTDDDFALIRVKPSAGGADDSLDHPGAP